MITSCSWGVLVAHYQQSKSVGEELTVRGVDHFIPLIEKQIIQRGRRVSHYLPLLGDYVLITISSVWRELTSLKGVSGILLNDSSFPAQVLPHEVERLKQMCPNDVLIQTESEKRKFSYGQRVTPQSGPFAFQIGIYDHQTKRGNDEAVFKMFGREQKIIFKKGELVAA